MSDQYKTFISIIEKSTNVVGKTTRMMKAGHPSTMDIEETITEYKCQEYPGYVVVTTTRLDKLLHEVIVDVYDENGILSCPYDSPHIQHLTYVHLDGKLRTDINKYDPLGIFA